MAIVHVSVENYLAQLPLFVVWLVGIVLALVYWRRHPTVSLLAIIACVALFATAIAGTYLAAALPLLLRDWGLPYVALARAVMVKNFALNLVTAAWWGLLLGAIFSGRGR